MWLWQAGTGSSALENRAPRPTKIRSFIHLMLLTLPSLSSWNLSHPTGSKGHSTLSKEKAFPSAPGHMHTLSPQLCPCWGHGSVLQPKYGMLHLHVQRSNLICTVRLDLWILRSPHLFTLWGKSMEMVKLRLRWESVKRSWFALIK